MRKFLYVYFIVQIFNFLKQLDHTIKTRFSTNTRPTFHYLFPVVTKSIYSITSERRAKVHPPPHIPIWWHGWGTALFPRAMCDTNCGPLFSWEYVALIWMSVRERAWSINRPSHAEKHSAHISLSCITCKRGRVDDLTWDLLLLFIWTKKHSRH